MDKATEVHNEVKSFKKSSLKKATTEVKDHKPTQEGRCFKRHAQPMSKQSYHLSFHRGHISAHMKTTADTAWLKKVAHTQLCETPSSFVKWQQEEETHNSLFIVSLYVLYTFLVMSSLGKTRRRDSHKHLSHNES